MPLFKFPAGCKVTNVGTRDTFPKLADSPMLDKFGSGRDSDH